MNTQRKTFRFRISTLLWLMIAVAVVMTYRLFIQWGPINKDLSDGQEWIAALLFGGLLTFLAYDLWAHPTDHPPDEPGK
jgi:drug/metabolite transporter (DMT)-like permease